jgi:polysaccharide export outer membrane protein
MKYLRAILLSAFVMFLTMAVAAQGDSTPTSRQIEAVAKQPQPVPPQAVSPDYVLGNDDVLAISIWRDPEISRTVPIRPDGRVSLPLIGEVQAKGLTPKQLQANLTTALRTYMANPEVTVIVQEVRSSKFNILGEVARPGSYPLSKPTTVVDALAIAGGFRDFAKVKKIYILRVQPDGSRIKIPFNYKDVVERNRFEKNVELQSQDTIIVP